jgi:hypothetical protein
LIALPPDTGVFGGAEFMATGDESKQDWLKMDNFPSDLVQARGGRAEQVYPQ